MANKTRLPKGYSSSRASSDLSRMKFIDMQRACIIRGMEFDELVNSSVYNLQSWFRKNYIKDIDTSRLDAFDKWREDYLKSKGDTDTFIRLGFIDEKDVETGEVISTKRPRGIRKNKKSRRERDKVTGLFSGTKKSITFQCQREGKTIEETLSFIKEKFPDAKEKSISIWYLKSRRLAKAGQV